ncbi:alkaline phosphatase [Georgenia satyanarayanai]|uniref:Alkaline phosphatase n=1 Tax=Georgenia satyanarayanai TaxID=860221 RepID=A0A2Y9AWJ1_9MICO|nr:alkaline phosphatase [Georgenia satyanarayanai]PYF96367.1 alkaline phosphatase [Georgenia satyanarayanai]SSA46907.1 alkaline phosphatase [Georgenia satyanarayanai]
MAVADVSDHGGATRNVEDRTAALEAAIMDGPAKNVILIIGDGMGASEITIARNYAEGAAGTLPGLDPLLVTGQKTTYDLTPDGEVHYVPDSASTASAWATGTKTYTGALSIDVENNPQDTLLEIAKANGLKTGNVSTSEIQDATPAALFAHVNARRCYGPQATATTCPTFAKENGGLGSITEQLLDARADVVLGGGNATMGETAAAGPWAGQTLQEQAAERGYTYLTDSAELAGLSAADQSAPVLGLFTPGNFPVRYTGPIATEGGGNQPAASCTENPEWDPATSLGTMTGKAIELLDGDEGFFLQVESASIDKRDHSADACGQIGETIELDEAVQAALDFAKADGETLVVITADHSHTSQIVGSTPPGLSVNLLTADGQEMIVAYGTAPAGGSQQHTGASVPIAAYGPGGANVAGLTDDTDTFFTTMDALELNGDLASLSAAATLTLEPSSAAPGQTVTAASSELFGDRQVLATVGGEPVGQADVIDGVASFDVTAPETPGEYPVVLTGVQTGTELTASLVVSQSPTTPAPGDDGDDNEPDTGGVVDTDDAGGPGIGAAPQSAAGGPLAVTGAEVALAALLAALLLGSGGAAFWLRNQRLARVG